MNQSIAGRPHARGRGRIWVGIGISGIALFWLAGNAGWLGAGGMLWPLLVLALGLAILVGGRRHALGLDQGEAPRLKGGRP